MQRGASIVFVDIRSDTLNIDETLIEDAVTPATKAIVPVHYAGVSCEMDTILDIAKHHNLKVIEDAAQGFGSTYKGRPLGTIGDFGCYSFHETKNLSMGEGGAILFQDNTLQEKAEILREKGTNRSKFFRGQIDKYTWMDYGSSYLPSDLNAAYLWAQLEAVKTIQEDRMASFRFYNDKLKPLAQRGYFEQPVIPEGIDAQRHMYYIKLPILETRSKLITYLKKKKYSKCIPLCTFTLIPCRTKFGRFHGIDRYTTKESERLFAFTYVLWSNSGYKGIYCGYDCLLFYRPILNPGAMSSINGCLRVKCRKE